MKPDSRTTRPPPPPAYSPRRSQREPSRQAPILSALGLGVCVGLFAVLGITLVVWLGISVQRRWAREPVELATARSTGQVPPSTTASTVANQGDAAAEEDAPAEETNRQQADTAESNDATNGAASDQSGVPVSPPSPDRSDSSQTQQTGQPAAARSGANSTSPVAPPATVPPATVPSASGPSWQADLKKRGWQLALPSPDVTDVVRLANIALDGQQTLQLDLLGAQEICSDTAEMRLQSSQPHRWDVMRGGPSRTADDSLGSFVWEQGELRFSWAPHARSSPLLGRIRYLPLKLSVGSEEAICQLTPAAYWDARGLKLLDKNPVLVVPMPVELLGIRDQIRLQVTADTSSKWEFVPRYLRTGQSGRFRLYDQSSNTAPFLQLNIDYKSTSNQLELSFDCFGTPVDAELDRPVQREVSEKLLQERKRERARKLSATKARMKRNDTEIKKLQSRVSELSSRMANARNINEMSKQLRIFQEQLSTLQQAQVKLEKQISNWEDEQDWADEITRIARELQDGDLRLRLYLEISGQDVEIMSTSTR